MRDFLLILLLVLAVASSCGSGDDYYYYIEDFEEGRYEEEISEEIIVSYVETFPKIAGANASVSGGLVVVGVRLDGDYTSGEVAEIKKDVIKRVKAKNPHIKNVAVTTTPDMYNKILNKNIDFAEPVDDFFEIAVPLP